MGSESYPSKRRFDLTMSKRTRRPLNIEDSDGNRTTETGSPRKETPDDLKGGVAAEVDQVEEETDHKSLKQLINGDNMTKVKTGEECRGRNSLGEHFTEEEKQLQLVKTQQQKGAQGVKFRGMVNHYAKVLSHLIKAKSDPRTIAARKKPHLRLTI